jgi:hypothetical protein
MKVSEAKSVAKAVLFALTNASKHGGASTDRGLGMRYAAYDIANETWYDLIQPALNLRRTYPSKAEWMLACGFGSLLIAE